jgi:exosortase A-associated hydrolase 2
MPIEAFFLPDGDGGQRFCIYHAPAGKARSAIVYVHPFAEEMNKSRRMAAVQARALANAGHAVLQMDLLGCGDSSGNFGDATWSRWLDDVALACRWLAARHTLPLSLWGLRAGALLAVQAAARLDATCSLLLWQPATSGALVLQQFLRLQVAGEMLGGQARGVMAALKAQLAARSAVEVAGYRLSPSLAAGLGAASLAPAGSVAQVDWLELSTRDAAALPPASAACVATWQAAGYSVATQIVRGSAFWHSVEVEEAPALIEATLGCFGRKEPVIA